MKPNGLMAEILPEGERRSRVEQTLWRGLNRRRSFNSGALSDCKNVDTTFLPALRGAREPVVSATGYTDVLGAYAAENMLFIIYKSGTRILADLRRGTSVFTGILSENAAEDNEMRCVVAFNRYSTPLDPLSGTYEKQLLVFPDCKCCQADCTADFTFADLAGESDMPRIRYATVYLSRVFGVDGDRVYASAFNDPSDWELDTSEDISAQNAWATTSQSDTRAIGGFTAVACCDGCAVCFRGDYMQQIYNNKNPFRLVDIGSWGCLDNAAHCVWNNTLAFASSNGIWLYSGGYPKCISDPLAISDFTGTRLAAGRDLLYAYVPSEGRIFVYENTGESWGERALSDVSLLTGDGESVYAFCKDGRVLKLDEGDYGSFSLTSDSMTLGVVNPNKLTGIAVTAQLGEGAALEIEALIGDQSVTVASSCSPGLQVIRSALNVTRSDFAGFRFSGYGKVDLFGLSISYAKTEHAGGAG